MIDLDIQSFFDGVDWGHLRRFLNRPVRDGVIRRAIGKWLNAGVMKSGEVFHPDRGMPQGGVISPPLANVYLHYVFDPWVQKWRRRTACGEVIVVRYADDMVSRFQHRQDAEDCMIALGQRMDGFGFALHLGKTRLLEFGRHAANDRKRRGEGSPQTFDLLGIPRARIVHPYPNVRFSAKHPRQAPGAVVPHAGICAGRAG